MANRGNSLIQHVYNKILSLLVRTYFRLILPLAYISISLRWLIIPHSSRTAHLCLNLLLYSRYMLSVAASTTICTLYGSNIVWTHSRHSTPPGQLYLFSRVIHNRKVLTDRKRIHEPCNHCCPRSPQNPFYIPPSSGITALCNHQSTDSHLHPYIESR